MLAYSVRNCTVVTQLIRTHQYEIQWKSFQQFSSSYKWTGRCCHLLSWMRQKQTKRCSYNITDALDIQHNTTQQKSTS